MKQAFLIIQILLITSFSLTAQSFIGWTEDQIRQEMKDNPNAVITEKYEDGKKNLIVVDDKVKAVFEIDKITGYCNKSGLQFKNIEVMNSVISSLNTNYQVIEKNKIWETVLRGHKIRMELRYSEKLGCYLLISIEVK